MINAGEISNKGFEVLVYKRLRFVRETGAGNLDVNLARNTNEVVELVEGQTSLVLGESRHRGNYVTADVGETVRIYQGPQVSPAKMYLPVVLIVTQTGPNRT